MSQETLFDGGIQKSADLEGSYRYRLDRWWGPGKRLVFVMLNPSTADALKDDQTIKRCMYFARREKCDGITVVNLFAWRTTFPSELRKALADGHDIVGPRNLETIREVTAGRSDVVLAWGQMSFKDADRYNEVLRKTFAAMPERIDFLCLGATANESPRHPSRLGNDAEFEEYIPDLTLLPEGSLHVQRLREMQAAVQKAKVPAYGDGLGGERQSERLKKTEVTLTFTGEVDADELELQLRYVARQIGSGFREGELVVDGSSRGWWKVERP